jgi:hypothetical protein
MTPPDVRGVVHMNLYINVIKFCRSHCVLDKIMNMDALSAKMRVVLYLVSQTMQDIM